MATEFTGIIAGISIDRENEIQPEFDANLYKFIIGQDGHDLTFTPNGSGSNSLTINGFVIADGIRAFFNNAVIQVSANGYVYVEFNIHHDENIADSATIIWSNSSLTETHDLIGSQAGFYRMKVLEVVSYEGRPTNRISYPLKARNTNKATTVTGSLESNVTAVTQETSDNSTRVATTEFVKKVRDEALSTTTISAINWTNLQSPINSTVSLENQAGYVKGRIQLSSIGLSDTSSWTIGSLPVGFRPKQSIETAAGVSGADNVLYLNIGTSGTISVEFTGSPTDNITIDANIGYETA